MFYYVMLQYFNNNDMFRQYSSEYICQLKHVNVIIKWLYCIKFNFKA
jgi:hypothetical protein